MLFNNYMGLYKFLDWIDITKIDWICLSRNKYAINILEQNIDKVNWNHLSRNENTICILEKNFDKVIWNSLSLNINAINILEKNIDAACIEKTCLFYSRPQSHIIEFATQILLGADKFDWKYLSMNVNAIKILEKNIDEIDWYYLSSNINAIHILEKNYDKISWNSLSENTNAIHILEKNLDKIKWDYLSQNINAIHLLEQNFEKINWYSLSRNENTIHLLEKNLDKINWDILSLNINAISILENNLDKVNWDLLSLNTNAISILENNLDAACIEKTCLFYSRPQSHIIEFATQIILGADKINWNNLSCNINAIHILENNLNKINWHMLFENDAIFELDLKFFKQRMDIIREELMMKVYNPLRFERYMNMGYDIADDQYINV